MNKTYLLSLYVKSDKNTKVRVKGNSGVIGEISVPGDPDKFQRGVFRVSNYQYNKQLAGIEIDGDANSPVFWDDVSIVDAAATDVFLLSDEELKSFYGFTSISHVTYPDRIRNATSMYPYNVPSIINDYVVKYRAKGTHKNGVPIDEIRTREESSKFKPRENSDVGMFTIDFTAFTNKEDDCIVAPYRFNAYAITLDNREIDLDFFSRSLWCASNKNN
ncbi:hypothetical protein [Bacillus cereus]|uniref:hypothetical protein n=1 Tax=Bacillus cereus TaxID=1396 RepID=UPI000BF91506|nr:hypothetical protein [Bacillus cereus]PFA72360.1 hypothetical protein CN403_12835 [Bacillus cereus]